MSTAVESVRKRTLVLVLALAVVPLVTLLARLPTGLRGLPAAWRLLVGELLVLVLTLAVVAGAGWWRQTGLRGRWRQPLLALVLVAFVLVQWALATPALVRHGRWSAAFALAAVVLLVGFNEETLVRGLVLHSLRGLGPLPAGLVSALLFGALHLLNLLGPLTLAYVSLQAVQAALFGLLFAALRLRMGLLWPLIAAHALIDLPALLAGFPGRLPPVTPLAAAVSVALLLPFGMTGLGLLLWEQLEGGRPRAQPRAGEQPR